MKHAIFSITASALVCAACLFSLSCKSIPVEIPADMTAQELIQNGQSSFEKGKNKEALRYFNTVIEHYGTDQSLYIEARYEIGHMMIKQKKYDKAAPILEEIRDMYASAQPGSLPGAYQKLAAIELAKIPADQLKKIDAEIGARKTADSGTDATSSASKQVPENSAPAAN
jgi:hypothetical protein